MSQPQSDHRTLSAILGRHEPEILAEWAREQASVRGRSGIASTEAVLLKPCQEFLGALRATIEGTRERDVRSPAWEGIRGLLERMSRSRVAQGFSPSETASFIFSLKRPIFAALRRDLGSDPQALADATWAATELLDAIGLLSIEAYQKTREDVISRQQEEMLELSTPVVKLWHGILALPMIGTLDSARTQSAMETLLERIVETGSSVAILDITGVPTVDTMTAQHLLKTVTAARLMGAECIISGIRPQIAQTIVHLGVELGDVVTKASLADAFAVALERTGRRVVAVRRSPR
jgi:rsbT co-antagonist protein RsbR